MQKLQVRNIKTIRYRSKISEQSKMIIQVRKIHKKDKPLIRKFEQRKRKIKSIILT